MKEELWTIRDIINWSVPYLKKHESPTARLDAELLLANSLNCQRIDLYLHYDKPLNVEERHSFRTMLKRRAAGEPIAYILGNREFYGLSFKLTKDVLIPRPETEHLVEIALSFIQEKSANNEPLRVLDIGTGSGCIAVALKKNHPQLLMEAWDISEAALHVARANALEHGVEIDFKLKNALDESAWDLHEQNIDIICSNPPYIGLEEQASLPKSVRDFEPHQALFAGENGLLFYQMLAQTAARKLKPSGYLVCEIGSEQGQAVTKIFQEHGWETVTVHQDLAGLDRVVSAFIS